MKIIIQKTGCKILKIKKINGGYRVLYDGGSSFLHFPFFKSFAEMKHGLLLTDKEIEIIKKSIA